MALASRLAELVRACFTGLWIESHEHDDAITEIAKLCNDEAWRLATWDIDSGLKLPGTEQTVYTGTNDPLAAVNALSAFPALDKLMLLVLVNFHRFLQSAEIVQALAQQISARKQKRKFVVILSPLVQIPRRVKKLFRSRTRSRPD